MRMVKRAPKTYDPAFLANGYGNFSFNNDVLPDGFICVTHERLLDGRKFPKDLNIPYVPAVHGWSARNTNRYRRFMRPTKVGIIIHQSLIKHVEAAVGEEVSIYDP